MSNSIKMLLDVKMPVSAILGQTKLTIAELLKQKKGSLIEINRMAGESVDLLIDGKIIAKGEITVLNDRLAIRISQLYSEKERFKQL